MSNRNPHLRHPDNQFQNRHFLTVEHTYNQYANYAGQTFTTELQTNQDGTLWSSLTEIVNLQWEYPLNAETVSVTLHLSNFSRRNYVGAFELYLATEKEWSGVYRRLAAS